MTADGQPRSPAETARATGIREKSMRRRATDLIAADLKKEITIETLARRLVEARSAMVAAEHLLDDHKPEAARELLKRANDS